MRLFLITLCLTFMTTFTAYAQSKEAKAVLITDAAVTKGSAQPNIALTGSVFFTKASDVASESAGKIIKVFVKNADTIKQGQPIAQLDDSLLSFSIITAEANTKQTFLNFEKAKRDHVRNKSLYDMSSISQQKYQDSLTDLQNAENAYKSATAAEQKLKTEKERMTIKAPFDGVITNVPIEVGEWMSVGSTAASIASQTYEARIYLPEKVLQYTASGQKVQVNAMGKDFIGTLISVNPKGDAATRTFEAKIALGASASLKEGVQAVVRVPSGKHIEALFVPRDAVVTVNQEKGVYKIVEGSARFIPIDIVGYDGGNIAIHSSALLAGDRVIMKGNDKVKNGAKIRIAAN